MTGWDLMSWAAIAVLGPGALVIFVAFLRDVGRLLGSKTGREEETNSHSR